MSIKKINSAEDQKLLSSFQAVRKTLLKDRFAQRREMPLAYWALPNDRRLPLAFLSRTVDDLLATPFEELAGTPGIGQKKISTFVTLLHRAVEDEPVVPFGDRESAGEGGGGGGSSEPWTQDSFDPSAVSESRWAKWRQTVRQHRLGTLPLGRLAPTLTELPTVIWHKPLGDYLDHSVAEIRGMKTHGEKRVRVVLEVFGIIHAALAEAHVAEHLEPRLMPRFAGPIQAWILQVLGGPSPPDLKSLREHVTQPLLDQLLIDAGQTVHDLAAGRLGAGGEPKSVRSQAKQLGVTRARVYQLLDDCGQVMAVRWPEGQTVLETLARKLDSNHADEPSRQLLATARELFFPEKADAGNNGRP